MSFLFAYSSAQTGTLSGTITSKEKRIILEGVEIFSEEINKSTFSDKNGKYQIKEIPYGKYKFTFYTIGYQGETIEIEINQSEIEFNIQLGELEEVLNQVEVTDVGNNQGLSRMRDVEEFGLYGGKKSEVILLESISANVASNNPREVFKGISGLTIQENDAAGLQLSIGARGLDPNRTSNFNTRQNGYDISADALGYPESYYAPPVQALKRIEIVRGAASLQYGTQFGGLLNFIFKEASENKFRFSTENSYGSFNFFNSFNEINGTINKFKYSTFYQYKRGDGQRPNSGFEQYTAHANMSYQITPKLEVKGEYTFMNYLAQQPGGLVDFEFEQDPFQSKRERNWFKVNWNLASLSATYKFNDKTRINTRNFFLSASREALGELGPINRPDPLAERDLVRGDYNNFGNETRFIHQYNIKGKPATFLIGSRIYRGNSESIQGDASDGKDADFNLLNPDNPEGAVYTFPSQNYSLFAEHIFNITDKFSITPGLRYEYIKTAADGYFKNRVFSGGVVIFENTIPVDKENKRQFILAGLGTAYRLDNDVELYANFSQNYRSINFTDLAVLNPNLVVDSLLQDESGYNFDLGIRGNILNNRIRFDATGFVLRYNNRIGITDILIDDPVLIERVVDYRTNIGDALITGIESYIEADIWRLINEDEKEKSLIFFSNLSFIKGKYLTGEAAIVGNEVELIPPINWKTGLDFRMKNLKASIQYSLVTQHFSDATNAESVANATRGILPTYDVLDISASYTWKFLKFSAGLNNALNEKYFTRRTTNYPGPGIIPAQGRSFYVGVKYVFGE